jgi:hypothetical protein
LPVACCLLPVACCLLPVAKITRKKCRWHFLRWSLLVLVIMGGVYVTHGFYVTNSCYTFQVKKGGFWGESKMREYDELCLSPETSADNDAHETVNIEHAALVTA